MQPSSKMLPSAIQPHDAGGCRFAQAFGFMVVSRRQQLHSARSLSGGDGWVEAPTAYSTTRFLV